LSIEIQIEQPMNNNEKDRPLITFLLIAYNQESFIDKAIDGAFSQTYSPLQIILSDDCSKDKTFEIMQRRVTSYRGPHAMIVRRNEKNLGIGGHINRAMAEARGELIVGAAGDDVSLPFRVERLWNAYRASGNKAISVFSNEYLIDESDNRQGATLAKPPKPQHLTLDWFTRRQASVIGSSHMWHRKTFDFFGPMDSEVMSEDAVIPYRSLLLGAIEYIHEPLVLRRFTGQNLYLGSVKSGAGNKMPVSRFQSIKRRHAENFYAVYCTRQRDLDTMLQRYPERCAELIAAQLETAKKREQVRNEIDFWSSNRIDKGKILLRLLFGKSHSLRAFSHLLAAWTMPSFYMRSQHLLNGMKKGI
jgi:glycosyltransferase involved in cell wall biosynthesis